MQEENRIIDQFVENSLVVFPAGGKGERIKHLAAGSVVHKSVLPLDNGETLMGRLIRGYAQVGYRQFLVIPYHYADSVTAHFDTWQKKYGIEITPVISHGRGTGIF